MDYLLVGIASILFPYVLNLSGIDYQAYVGLKGSLQDVNQYELELVDNKGNYIISQVELINYTGYGIRPDFFVDYAMSKGRFWFAPTFGVEPLNTGIQFRTKLSTGGSDSTDEVHYNKGAYIGLKLGFSILQPNQELNGYGAFGITPYILGGVRPVAYENGGYYKSSEEKRYEPFFGIGAKIDFKGPWSAYIQYQRLEFETKGSALARQITISESEIQFGVAYWFRTSEESSKLDKVSNYDQIVQKINEDNVVTKDPNKKLFTLPSFLSPKGTPVKDGDSSPSRSNTEQAKSISSASKELKSDSKLSDKAKKKKEEGLQNLNIGNMFDF